MLDTKTKEEIKILQEGGHILSNTLKEVCSQARAGVSGKELDKIAEDLITKAGGRPSFKNYNGFPATLCVSVNQTIVHGMPNDKPFKEGDVVGIDIGMEYKGLYTDMATTIAIGKVSKEVQEFLDVTKKSLDIGIAQVAPGKYISDIGQAIEKFIKPYGYGIVRDLAGHGVGRAVHENPTVPNYNPQQRLDEMVEGLVIAIEPMMIIGGDHRLITAKNGWDANASDNSLTAHFEHTVAVTAKGHLIITK